MNRRYALPVAIALTFHAVLFLGSGKPPVKTEVPPPPPTKGSDDIDKLMQLLKPEEVTASSEEGGTHSDNSAVERPPSIPDVPPNVSPSDGTMTQTYVMGDPPGNATKLNPDALRPGGGGGSGDSSRLLTPDQLDETPRVRSQKEPAYPATLRSERITGTVVVAFVVDENGRVHDVRVVKSSDDRFSSATVSAVSEWRFEPGKRKGFPVRFRMSVPVVFRLEDL